MQDEYKACFPKTRSLLLAPPHPLWMEQRLAMGLPVSPVYPEAEAIGMHSTARSGLSRGTGLWDWQNYTKT